MLELIFAKVIQLRDDADDDDDDDNDDDTMMIIIIFMQKHVRLDFC